ncbi:zinc finger CCHC domain containing protein 4 [Echinococcus multilocularis]|uniref:Zinc finger CCHC domain containing protein 4 n=1 Tax=Echinococcus multilocularis TaxID=6211 RepID=A0A068Y938_ECHMU|nr:zinc finger CCHC domain containing protein 4 [Echinococcus multilocularis]
MVTVIEIVCAKVECGLGVGMSEGRARKRGFYSTVCAEDGAPCCAHGPKLCLKRKDRGSSIYVCSAFRNASACSRDRDFTSSQLPSQTAESLVKYTRQRRCYCQTCRVLFVYPDYVHEHHRVISGLPSSTLAMPSYFLEPLEESSEHAQYYFSEDWLKFMASTLRILRIDNVLCVGTPRLFDFLTACSQDVSEPLSINKFLLDLDARLEGFYPTSLFARFNALNGHFFKSAGEDSFNNFMRSCGGRTMIFCDPPFGVLMEPLVASLNKLKRGLENTQVFVMVTVPYFIGKKLLQAAPELKMLDYKVTYEKHVRFMSTGYDGNNSKRRVSVVRPFTDVPPHEILPPKSLAGQYWFCEICQRYSDLKNLHCDQCNACTTFHGETYQHCISCNVCHPPGFQHCVKCDMCFRPKNGKVHICNKQLSDNHDKPKRRKVSTQCKCY